MMTDGERNLMLGLIKQIGRDWEENDTAENIRMDEGKIDTLLAVRDYTIGPGAAFDAATLAVEAPEFCSVFEAVTLRKIEEHNTDGSADS